MPFNLDGTWTPDQLLGGVTPNSGPISRSNPYGGMGGSLESLLGGGTGGAWGGGGLDPMLTGAGGSRSQESSQSRSYHTNPALVDSLARSFGGLYESVVPVYQDFMRDPVNSNTFQTQLRSLLASLAPGEEDARNELTDRFRAAGGLRSGAHGVSGARLEGDIIGRRQNAAGTLLGQTISQMTQLLGLPMQQLAPLISALELQEASSQGTKEAWEARQSGRSGGGGGGGGGGSTRRPTPGGGGPPTPTERWPAEGRPPTYEDDVYDWWNPWDVGGGGGGGDDWNDYYNRTGDSGLDWNLGTEVEVPGLGIGTQGGRTIGNTGDDWNDYYYNGADEGF